MASIGLSAPLCSTNVIAASSTPVPTRPASQTRSLAIRHKLSAEERRGRGATFFRGDVDMTAAAAGGSGGRIRMAAGNAYICKDCGYIYNDRKPFESLSASEYSCPVCQAPKRRFKPYEQPVDRNANSLSTRKARKDEMLKKDAAIGSALPILVGVILVGLVGALLYLNAQY